MTTRKEAFFMNAERRIVSLAAAGALAVAVLAPACFEDDPCGKGLVEVPTNGNCQAAPPPPAPDAGGGGDGGGSTEDGGDSGAAPAGEATFGKACTAPTDCGSLSPVCNPQLPYCTQTDCKPGEAHADICPAGFTCMVYSGFPSFCMKQ